MGRLDMNAHLGRRRLLVIALAAAAAACASGPAPERQAPERNTAEDYQLGPGDIVRVTIYGEPDLSGQFEVGAQGTIAFPLIGETRAAGMTLAEFGASLADALRQGYVRQPNIGVEVMNYRPFFILGEVNTPGTYPYSANLTVYNAVATAGGFTPRADRRHVFIKRASDDKETAYRLSTTTPVLPGDTIRIRERHF
jgi:polysaccharide biosynthesis/export protein